MLVRHSQIVWWQPELFFPDGVHLSPLALEMFVSNLAQGLLSFF